MKHAGRGALLGRVCLANLFVAAVRAWGSGHVKISTQALRVQPMALQQLLNNTTIRFLGKSGSAASFFGGEFAESGDVVAGPCGATGKACSAASAELKMTYRDFCYAQSANGSYSKPWPYAIPVCNSDGKPPPPNTACIPPPKVNPWLYHYFTQPPADDRSMEAKGAAWYIAQAATAFSVHNITKAMLHLACFAHGMEDRSSPYHAFGGFDSEKADFEAKYNLTAVCKSHWPQMPPSQRPRCEILFWGPNEPSLANFAVPGGYKPKLLGASPAAAGMVVGARMEAIANHSRFVASRPGGYIESHLKDDNWWLGNASANTLANMAEMGQGSTRLVADCVYTAWYLGTKASAVLSVDSSVASPAKNMSDAEWNARVEKAARLDRLAPR